jgi:hypothetical protein
MTRYARDWDGKTQFADDTALISDGASSGSVPVSPSVVSEATAEEKIGSLIRICGGRF